jgi:hypothetical protein
MASHGKKHYLQVTEKHFKRAQKAQQNPQQSAAERGSRSGLKRTLTLKTLGKMQKPRQ